MDASIDTPTAAPLIWPKSACNLCDINCGVELGISGDGAAQRIVKVRGDADNPRSRGYLCNKAQAIPSQVHHRDRLTTPLRRRADGGHEPIDWDTAVREIAERLGAVVAARGGKTVAAFGGGGQGNHAGGSYAFGFLRALGSRTVFNALAQEKTGDLWLNGLLNARPTHRRHILQPYPTPMHPMSITSVFTNNRSQAVRLPADVRLPEGVKKVQVRARGVDRIISPVGQTWNEFFLNGPQASDDFMAERASQQQSGREAF